MTTAAQALRTLRADLRAAGIDSADLDARHLFEHVTGLGTLDLIRDPERELDANQLSQLAEYKARRISGEPVHRIMGYREFHGLRLTLSPDTLEPRPDTEILVDALLPWLHQRSEGGRICRMVDLGTGSGAIALALLAEISNLQAVGTDLSAGALETAARNAHLNHVAERFTTIQSDWFAQLTGQFDLIVSNPPYIASREIEDLSREVREHDPMRALDGGADGLDAYRALAYGAQSHLLADGLVGLEIGWDQKESVTALFESQGFDRVSAHKDYGGQDRVLIFKRA